MHKVARSVVSVSQILFHVHVLASLYPLLLHSLFVLTFISISCNSCNVFPCPYLITSYTSFSTLSLTLCSSPINPRTALKSRLIPILTPSFFHFASLLLLPPPLMSSHISLSSSGWLPFSLGLPLSLLHTPDALLLAPVCPKGLIDSER